MRYKWKRLIQVETDYTDHNQLIQVLKADTNIKQLIQAEAAE